MFVSTSENEFHEPIRIHDYSILSSSPSPFNGSRQSIDMVRRKFPELEQLEATNSLPPCVIHLNVGISLMKERPDGAELNTRVSISINLILLTWLIYYSYFYKWIRIRIQNGKRRLLWSNLDVSPVS